MPRTVVVVPCYNEALRLEPERFEEFAAGAAIELLFVDDGSSDGTREVIARICARLGDRAGVLHLPRNEGKAEAVRAGMRDALARGADAVGYLDADLATPPGEMLRLHRTLRTRDADVILGARVALLGTDIYRRRWRHYLGRVFATFASIVLSLRVYDTQCGAKLFRASALLAAVLQDRFVSRWAFDVELIGRLLCGTPEHEPLGVGRFVEIPLQTWRDVRGSKIRSLDFPRMLLELLRIWRHLGARRRSRAAAAAWEPGAAR